MTTYTVRKLQPTTNRPGGFAVITPDGSIHRDEPNILQPAGLLSIFPYRSTAQAVANVLNSK
jgi:hypothetical protein